MEPTNTKPPRLIDANELERVTEESIAEFGPVYYTGDMIYGMRLVCQYATEGAPTVQAFQTVQEVTITEPVRHGRWIEWPECAQFEDAYSEDHIACSVCGCVFSVLDNCCEAFDYCPHCGAKMDAGEEKCD